MCIQQHGWFVVAGMGDDITPPGDILIVKVDEVDRGSETGIDLLQFVVMVLQATNATGFSTGKTDDLVPPILKVPSRRVPVTTVPNPVRVKHDRPASGVCQDFCDRECQPGWPESGATIPQSPPHHYG